jgi:hypothetical protein
MLNPPDGNRQFTVHSTFSFFFGEGPRSRSYGRTAALRLIVQPYDEDHYFFHFYGAPMK